MARLLPLPLLLLALALLTPARADAYTAVRVDQVGYAGGAGAQALVLSSNRLGHALFSVVGARGGVALLGRLGADRGPWSRRFRHVYVADFGRLRARGRYRVRVGRSLSPWFSLGPRPYSALVSNAVSFFQAQRDGAGVIPGLLRRRPSHLLDRAAAVYLPASYRGGRLAAQLQPAGYSADVAGGWFDAGDYLKFVETASFDDTLLLFALREHAGTLRNPSALAAEARYGTDWLLKMWDPARQTLLYQVGIGDGNGGSVLGDHDLWRLPQVDDRSGAKAGSPRYYVSHRPAFATSAPISPNLAGRTAAAFALCAQVFARSDPAYARRCLEAGRTLYDAAGGSWSERLVTTSPFDYYTEPEWHDDMELAATELYLGTVAVTGVAPPQYNLRIYLEPASSWADAYSSTPDAGQDSLNLYDVSALAHYDLYRALVATHTETALYTDASKLLGDLRDQLALGTRLAARDPFRLANPSTNVDTVPHALGYAIAARLYDRLVGRPVFERLARDQLAWVLGRNAWGSSFVVGAGSTYPHCLSHQVANLSGSLSGRGRVLVGATVDGPNARGDLGVPDGARACPRRGNRFGAFDGRGATYRDDVRSSQTSEPSDDYVALALLAFSLSR